MNNIPSLRSPRVMDRPRMYERRFSCYIEVNAKKRVSEAEFESTRHRERESRGAKLVCLIIRASEIH